MSSGGGFWLFADFYQELLQLTTISGNYMPSFRRPGKDSVVVVWEELNTANGFYVVSCRLAVCECVNVHKARDEATEHCLQQVRSFLMIYTSLLPSHVKTMRHQ